MDKIVTWDFTR